MTHAPHRSAEIAERININHSGICYYCDQRSQAPTLPKSYLHEIEIFAIQGFYKHACKFHETVRFFDCKIETVAVQPQFSFNPFTRGQIHPNTKFSVLNKNFGFPHVYPSCIFWSGGARFEIEYRTKSSEGVCQIWWRLDR